MEKTQKQTNLDATRKAKVQIKRDDILKKFNTDYYFNLICSCEVDCKVTISEGELYTDYFYCIDDGIDMITLKVIHNLEKEGEKEYALSFTEEKIRYTLKGKIPEMFIHRLDEIMDSRNQELYQDMHRIFKALAEKPLEVHADDLMPWGVYEGKSLRSIYKKDRYYFSFLCNNQGYRIGENTKEIILKGKANSDKSRLTFSTGAKLERTEYFPDDIIWIFGEEMYSLEQIFMENESCYRFLLNSPDIFISRETFESLMIKKYGPDSVKRKTREEIQANISNIINGFEFSEDEEYTDEDLREYIGEEVQTEFSSETAQVISNDQIDDKFRLKKTLVEFFGDTSAEFRGGQEEAILAVLHGKKTLVVQHTGWGKSLVYFMSIKKLREMGKGPAIIISPLLALMHNQELAATSLGLNIKALSSDNYRQWRTIYSEIRDDKLDAIIVSPERLGNSDFMRAMKDCFQRMSLFVVDEAHCISDWGHDFRPDFRRIVQVINQLPETTAVLATTATANDRVLRDIKKQLGNDLEIMRGTMDRKNIEIDILNLGSDQNKKAWLIKNLPSLKGPGIVYCLTIRDCEVLIDICCQYKINAAMYHGQLDPKVKLEIEKDFQDNKIDVLIATVAFGMGIDKADIAFVIHYQQPANVISYYQQIGRAGRGGEPAKAIMLAGDEDNQINQYFIKNAFPTENEMNDVIGCISQFPGANEREISRMLFGDEDVDHINWIKRVVKYLHVNGDLRKTHYGYYRTDKPWNCDMKRARMVSYFRWKELRRFNDFIDSEECYMKFIRRELDDKSAAECGHCYNCTKKHFI